MHADTEIQEKSSSNRVWVLTLFAIILTIRLLVMILEDNVIFPVNSLKIEAPYKNLPRNTIESILSPYLGKSFIMFSSQQLEKDLLKNPWVASAHVEKTWPDHILIQIGERFPVAIYNNMLLSEKGDTFSVELLNKFSKLPHFYGPKNQQKDILHIYEKLSKLLESQDLFITKVWLRDNQAWEIALHNGVLVRLGKQNIEERLLHFIQVYPKLFAKRFDQIVAVDLRYSNGIAVDWKKNDDQIKINPNNVMG